MAVFLFLYLHPAARQGEVVVIAHDVPVGGHGRRCIRGGGSGRGQQAPGHLQVNQRACVVGGVVRVVTAVVVVVDVVAAVAAGGGGAGGDGEEEHVLEGNVPVCVCSWR